MEIWVRIDSQPVIQLYANPSALDLMDASKWRFPYLLSVSKLVSTVGGEGANVVITLENRGLESTRLFAGDPPVGALVTVYQGDTSVFVGKLQGLNLSAIDCRLGVEA